VQPRITMGLRRVVRFLAAGRRALTGLAALRRVAISSSFLWFVFFESSKAQLQRFVFPLELLHAPLQRLKPPVGRG
jgi:hypothetical protein